MVVPLGTCVPNVYNLRFLPVWSFEMAHKTKCGKGKSSKKDLWSESRENLEKVNRSHGGRTVMLRLPHIYLCDLLDTSRALCGKLITRA